MSKSSVRYLERDRAQGNLFFEVTVERRTVHVRSGAAGLLGKTAEYEHPSDHDATADATIRIEKKLAEGYVELAGAAIWVIGQGHKGQKPMKARVPLDADRVVLGSYNAPQEQIDLRPLAEAEQLAELYISNHRLVALDLVPLARCPKLREIYLSNLGIKSLDLVAVAKCKSLEKLTVRDQKAVDLVQLAGASLATLSVMGGDFKTIDLAPLLKLPRLETLHIQQNPKLAKLDVRPIAAHKTLKLITLDATCEVEGACGAELRRFG